VRVARELAAKLAEAGGGTVSAVLLFGSRIAGTSPEAESAHDLVAVVDDYLRFYEAFTAAGHHRRSPRALSGLSTVLAPNVVAFFPWGGQGEMAKCMILSRDDFHLALSPDAPDHFVKGRLVQKVAVLRCRDAETRTLIEEDLLMARRDVLRWAGPFVEEPFTASDLARRMLQVSYAGEVRPESANRVGEVFEAQRPYLVAIFTDVLERAEADGEVERTGRSWRFTVPRTRWDRFLLRLYFLRSKCRATLRWFKHVITFDDWLTYIQRKVERRTGIHVEITPLERRYPLVLLWPKVVKVLTSRSGDGPEGAGPERGGHQKGLS
jgi:hypothetical protein